MHSLNPNSTGWYVANTLGSYCGQGAVAAAFGCQPHPFCGPLMVAGGMAGERMGTCLYEDCCPQDSDTSTRVFQNFVERLPSTSIARYSAFTCPMYINACQNPESVLSDPIFLCFWATLGCAVHVWADDLTFAREPTWQKRELQRMV